jgi:hypothetical protein
MCDPRFKKAGEEVHAMMRKSLQTVAIASLFMVPGLKTQDKSPRAYFDELKSAGAFMHTLTDVKGEKISAPDPGYVCFAENNSWADSSGLFLIFEAMAYDKNSAEAEAIFTSNASLEEKKKALARIEDIQHRQPYVAFLTDDLMALFPAEAANFFRKGGEDLDLSLYMNGVKDWTATFHRFSETDKWKSESGKMDFAVESSTMRFMWFVHGDKPQVLNGRCEKISKDKS